MASVSQVNDSLYLFYKSRTLIPNIQILFFHGLQRGPDYANAHVSTWYSRDGSQIWPQTWLVEEFPRAHVFSVSYTEGLKRVHNVRGRPTRVFLFLMAFLFPVLLALASTNLLGLRFFVIVFIGLVILLFWLFKKRGRGSGGSVDMDIVGENLLSDLLDVNIGSSCPVVLVGHSIGGLVIKQLCKQAHVKLSLARGSDKVRVTAFLNNIKGIFFYSTPHHGSVIASKLKQHFESHLLKYFETLSTPTARLNSIFEQISTQHYKWSFAGVGETLPTDMGPFKEVVVQEASARAIGGDFYSVSDTDHFSICRPINKGLASFGKLKIFIGNILSDLQEENERATARTIKDRKSGELNIVKTFVTVFADNLSEVIQEKAIKRLVERVGNGVDQETQKDAVAVLARKAENRENRVIIAKFPIVFKRLVNLLAKKESEITRSDAGRTLRLLSMEGHRRDHEVALEAYEDDLTATDPRHRQLLVWRCFVKANRGDYEGALTDINKFIELGGGRQLGLQERGIVRRMGGDLDGALADLNDSLSLESDDYECLKHRGLVKFLLQDENGALADAECALRVKPAGVDRSTYGTGLCLGTSSVKYLGYNLK